MLSRDISKAHDPIMVPIAKNELQHHHTMKNNAKDGQRFCFLGHPRRLGKHFRTNAGTNYEGPFFPAKSVGRVLPPNSPSWS